MSGKTDFGKMCYPRTPPGHFNFVRGNINFCSSTLENMPWQEWQTSIDRDINVLYNNMTPLKADMLKEWLKVGVHQDRAFYQLNPVEFKAAMMLKHSTLIKMRGERECMHEFARIMNGANAFFDHKEGLDPLF